MRLQGGWEYYRAGWRRKVVQGGRNCTWKPLSQDEKDPFTAFLPAPPVCLFSSCRSPHPTPKLLSLRLSRFKRKFFFLESLINFSSACTESWQRCVSHLNKRLRCYFLHLKNKLFLKKSKLTGTQQGRFLWPVFKKWALERNIVASGGSIRGPPGNSFL